MREESESSFGEICVRVLLNTYYKTAEYQTNETTRKIFTFHGEVVYSRNWSIVSYLISKV